MISFDGDDDATCTANMQGTLADLRIDLHLQWATGNMNVLTLAMAAGA